jgi:hypothetical protein
MPRKRTVRPWEIRDPQAEERVRRRAQLVHALGQFIEQHEWDHFLSFTSRYGTSPITLLSRFESFARNLEIEACHPVSWLAVLEKGGSLDPHVHGFLNRTCRLRIEDITKHWKWGNTRVLVYDPNLSGAFYVAEAVSEDSDLDWDFSDVLDSTQRIRQLDSSLGADSGC